MATSWGSSWGSSWGDAFGPSIRTTFVPGEGEGRFSGINNEGIAEMSGINQSNVIASSINNGPNGGRSPIIATKGRISGIIYIDKALSPLTVYGAAMSSINPESTGIKSNML